LLRVVLNVCYFGLIRPNAFQASLMDNLGKVALNPKAQDCLSILVIDKIHSFLDVYAALIKPCRTVK
jgi:hypothetical protein